MSINNCVEKIREYCNKRNYISVKDRSQKGTEGTRRL